MSGSSVTSEAPAGSPSPLIARGGRRPRSARPGEVERIRLGKNRESWVFDFPAARFRGPAGRIHLARKRTLRALLSALAGGRALTVAEAYEAGWGEPFDPAFALVVYVSVRRLRRLLEADPDRPTLMITAANDHGESVYTLSPEADWIAILPAGA